MSLEHLEEMDHVVMSAQLAEMERLADRDFQEKREIGVFKDYLDLEASEESLESQVHLVFQVQKETGVFQVSVGLLVFRE